MAADVSILSSLERQSHPQAAAGQTLQTALKLMAIKESTLEALRAAEAVLT